MEEASSPWLIRIPERENRKNGRPTIFGEKKSANYPELIRVDSLPITDTPLELDVLQERPSVFTGGMRYTRKDNQSNWDERVILKIMTVQ